MSLQDELKVAETEVRRIKKEILAEKRAEAPLCEKCWKVLWSEYYGCPQFIGVTLKDGSDHMLCETCAGPFAKDNKGNIEGAWDFPDPMGM